MLATCDHCGHRNEVSDTAANIEIVCEQCHQPFVAFSPGELAANRRATKILLSAILIFFALMAFLLFSHSTSALSKAARRALVGSSMASRLEGNRSAAGPGNGGGDTAGNGEASSTTNGGGNSGSSSAAGGNGAAGGQNDSIPYPLATGHDRPSGRSIGRLPNNLAPRRPGDEIRPGAAGTDEAAETIGNSRNGQVTNAPTAGANPGNSEARNSIETPEGDEPITGRGAGAEAGALTSTNSRNNALLLDDFSERLRQAGARSGDVQISLEWHNVNDLDLHVIDPTGERTFFSHPRSRSGGILDVDMNRGGVALTQRPVENIYWPERGAPRGTYRVEVVHFANHGGRDPTQFTVRVINKGQSSFYRGYVSFLATSDRATVPVCTFVVQ
jgi:hypothetical protein